MIIHITTVTYPGNEATHQTVDTAKGAMLPTSISLLLENGARQVTIVRDTYTIIYTKIGA